MITMKENTMLVPVPPPQLTLVSPPRTHPRGDPASPYFVNSGYIFAPATSANDSEISSDALTDDSLSMTDSSV